MRDTSIALYEAAADIALTKGMIIADTKFEFGLDENGTLVLMDEVLTPDSSRYWPVEGYDAALAPAPTRPATTSSSCATGWSSQQDRRQALGQDAAGAAPAAPT